MATAQTTPNLDAAFSQAAQQDQHPSSTPNMDDAFSQAAKGGVSSSGTNDPGKDTDSVWMQAIEGGDPNVPLTSYGAATKQGVLNLISGTSQAVQGLGSAVAHPISTVENMVSSAKAAPSQLAQIPAAVHDINQSPDPTGTYLNVAGKTAAQGAGQAVTALAGEGLGAGIKFTGAKAVSAVKNVTGVPAALSADVSSALSVAAHNEGLPPLASTTARESADELSKAFVDRAKSQYGVVDKAVGGDLKPVQERIINLKKGIRTQANINPDLADKYIEDLATQQKTLAGLVEKAKAAGVPNADDLMKAGDKDYAKGMAMKDVSKGVKTASGIAKSGGHPNPVLFANQIDRLYNKGTLTRALGEDGAQSLLDTAKSGLQKAKTAGTIKKVARSAAIGGVIGGAGAAGYASVRSALGGH